MEMKKLINEIYLLEKNTSKENQKIYLKQLIKRKNPKFFSKSYSGNYAALITSSIDPVAIDIEKKNL